jgi:signal transduction histidine kinase/ActR/RegA family two-component response regulator
MNFNSILASFMLLLGAGVLGASIMRLSALSSRLPNEISVERSEKINKIFAMHKSFTFLILLGYLVVVYAILWKLGNFSDVVVGVIFLFNAIFVFFSILLQQRTIRLFRKSYGRALEIRDALKREHSQLKKTRDILKRERSQLMATNEQLKREIEDRKRAEREKQKIATRLRQAQKMESIGTLAGGIAHDFNNILSAIMGYSEMTLYKLSEDSEARSNLEQVLLASNRARDLVNQILAFSRQSEQTRKPVQIGPLVKETLKLMRASLPTTINIMEQINEKGALIEADPTQIHQVLMNLCTNASDAMHEKGGALKVDLDRLNLYEKEAALLYPDLNAGIYEMLSVSDTGDGMDSATIERIFDPYFTTKKAGKGTGMGLAVAHGIVKSHGGVINVHSEKGKGTTFQVLLPSIDGVVKSEAEELKPLPRGDERILYVDDEATLVDLGQQMLEHLGYKVVGKTSSIEALDTFRAHPDDFDLILTDKTMPNLTGFDLGKECKEIRPDIPIILCTGFSESTLLLRAGSMGISEIIMKPLLMRDLAGAIRKVLDES